MRISYFLIFGCILPFAGVSSVLAFDLTDEELLERFEQSLSPFDRCEFQIEEHVIGRGRDRTDLTDTHTRSLRCRRDVEKWYFHIRNRDKLAGRGPETTTEVELIRNGKPIVVVRDPSNHNVRSIVALHQNPGENARRLVGNTGLFIIMFGYLQNPGKPLYLPELFRNSKRTASATKLDGRAVYRIASTSRYGIYTIWLDPGLGCLPRRIEYRKTGNDLIGDVPVNSPRMGLLLASLVVDRFEYEKNGGIWLIKSFVAHDTLKFSDHLDTTETVTRITDIDLNPTFAKDSFSPSPAIPDGTHVQVDDAPSIQFEWRRGEIVKVVDPNAVNRLGGLSFARERPWRMLAQAGLCVLVLFALGWRLARRGRA